LLVIREIQEVDVSKLMVLFTAAKSHGFVVTFLGPEFILEVPEQNILKLREVLLSDSRVEIFGEDWEQEF
jgi:hypothetical protein